MSGTAALISLLGEVALLLWAIHMVNSGVQRALGGKLNRFIAVGLRSRWRAFGAGLAATGLLQSSTATALIATSLTAGGLMDLTPALGVMLGANVGTTLVVQLLSFDVSLVYPVLILIGVAAFKRGRTSAVRDPGTALVGLGLMLLALHLLTETMRQVETSQVLRFVLQAVTEEPLFTLILAAGLSWAAHSSVAALLFIMSLTSAGVIELNAALTMVLGANLGSALNLLPAGLGKDPASLRLPVGNLVNRMVGLAVVLPFVAPLGSLLAGSGQPPARLIATFHVAFNVGLALVFIGPLPWFAGLLTRLLPARQAAMDPGAPRYLDEDALASPTVAVANAAREVLHMADVVGTMLRGSRGVFHADERDKVAEVRRMDDVLDRLYSAVQRYLGAMSHDLLNEAEARRVSVILALAINLEHIGDIIDNNLMELAAKRIQHQLILPQAALANLDEMHDRLLDHLQLAIAVFMSGDARAARRLVAEKEQFREIERGATQRHFAHLRGGRPNEIEASALQLDITRDLKRIEAHIAATAYGLLEQSGELRTSRLTS